jgi:hypothetical protein
MLKRGKSIKPLEESLSQYFNEVLEHSPLRWQDIHAQLQGLRAHDRAVWWCLCFIHKTIKTKKAVAAAHVTTLACKQCNIGNVTDATCAERACYQLVNALAPTYNLVQADIMTEVKVCVGHQYQRGAVDVYIKPIALAVQVDGVCHTQKTYKQPVHEQIAADGRFIEAAEQQGINVLRLHHKDMHEWHLLIDKAMQMLCVHNYSRVQLFSRSWVQFKSSMMVHGKRVYDDTWWQSV